MSGLAGDLLFTLLVVGNLLWDWRAKSFRGIVQQILGALCLGTVANGIVNPANYTANRVATIVAVYGVLTVLFYWWAWTRRRRQK